MTNEDGVFFYTIDGIAPHYAKELDRLWADWLLKKYGSQEKLAAAWGEDLKPRRAARRRHASSGCPSGSSTRCKPRRRPGPRDQLRFYFELNNDYFQKTKDALRGRRRAAADLRHRLVRRGRGLLSRNSTRTCRAWTTSTATTTTAAAPAAGRSCQGCPSTTRRALTEPKHILKLGMERVLGMPYGISEWANVLPNQWRLEAPPLMTFYGQCLNGWDVPIHFALEGGRRLHAVPQVDVAGQRALDALPIPGPGAGDPPRRRAAKATLVFARNLSEEKTLQRPAAEGRGDQGRHLRALRDVVRAGHQRPQPGQLLCRGGGQDRRPVPQGRRARLLHRPEQVPRHAEEGNPLDHRRTVLELRPGLRHGRHAAHAGGRGLPGRRAGEAGRLRDPHRRTAAPRSWWPRGTASR